MPLFVDHPTFSAWTLLSTSYTLTQRALPGVARFFAFLVMMLVAGFLFFGLTIALSAAVATAALAVAYRCVIAYALSSGFDAIIVSHDILICIT